MRKIIFFLLFFIWYTPEMLGQTTLRLEQCIAQAQENSLSRNKARLQKDIVFQDYQNYISGKKPQISIYGNAPVFNKDNFQVIQPDGSVKFISRSQNSSSLGLSLSQPITFTNGSVSLNTELYRLDNFIDKSTQYNSVPFYLQYNQPIFGFNQFKWDKQIESLKLKEADVQYQSDINGIALSVCQKYFDALEAQIDIRLYNSNYGSVELNISIEKKKLAQGQSTEDKVLQLEMQEINIRKTLESSVLLMQNSLGELNSILGTSDTTHMELITPEKIPFFTANEDEVIRSIKENSPIYATFLRKEMEAQSEIARAKASGKQVNLNITYGLNKASDNLSGIYNNPDKQQRLSVGFSLPLEDWGRQKNAVASARLLQKQNEIMHQSDELDLKTEVHELLGQIALCRKSISYTKELDSLSQNRYSVATRLYQAGRLSLLELQSAQTDKDTYHKGIVILFRQFWESYYKLKMLGVKI